MQPRVCLPETRSPRANAAEPSANGEERAKRERRTFKRMPLRAPIVLRDILTGKTYRGWCQELSGGGIGVDLDTELALGSRTEFVLQSSSGHAHLLRGTATVVRAQGHGTEFHTALRLLEILP